MPSAHAAGDACFESQMNNGSGFSKGWHARGPAAVCAFWALCLAPASAIATVEVAITHVGFPTLRSGDVVRAGQWVPIIVDLDLVDEQTFDGTIRVSQFDLDGDECFDSVEVHLRADTGGAQRHYLYIPVNVLHGRGQFPIELFDAQGGAVKVLSQGELTYHPRPNQYTVAISDDDLLILSLSAGTVGRVRDLVAVENQERIYVRQVHVGHVSPPDLPEHWIGLEAVDIIVWDDARPEELTLKQVRALVDWVRQGGTLLIAASRFSGSLKLSEPIDAVLPVDIGEIDAVTNLRDVREELLGPPRSADGVSLATDDWLDAGFPTPVSIARCTPAPGAEVIAYESTIASPVVVRGREGRGHVIFSAVRLKDLFSGEGMAVPFFDKVFHLLRHSNLEEERPTHVSLFHNVASAVSFSTKASVYLFIASASSIAYVLLATFGTWAFLRVRGMRHHSWSTFAVVALVAGAVTVLVVNSLQGFGESLHQVSVIDADAGDTYARATALFGLKTSSDKELDVWLPSNPISATEPGATDCFLRPMPTGCSQEQAPSRFADPQEYRIIPASAVIDDVRLRATLKQFEGRWHGQLDGTVTGQVNVAGRRVTDDSYVVNDLGVDLDPCYFLHAVLDIDEIQGIRDTAIYVYDVGPLPGDGLPTSLASRCYRPIGNETERDVMNRCRLVAYQERWSRRLRGLFADLGFGSNSTSAVALGEERTALLLLSTVGELSSATVFKTMGQFVGSRTISRDRLRQFDLREQLRKGGTDEDGNPEPGSAVLIGFAKDPGPMRLFRREGNRSYTMLKPDADRSWSMYRIRIPTGVGQAGLGTGKAPEPIGADDS
ncbi:MAG: hypothetical protein JSU63_02425 [Phycisphaerales bacterium]|nr:MAG: hypothetical protein JSU63_02425 [Phycisphaerales bacterium]